MIKCAALALCTGAVCLIIKKTNPELSLLLAVAGAVVIAGTAVSVSDGIREMFVTGKNMMGRASAYLAPMIKCVAIGGITGFSSAFCRDCGQNALGASVDLTGTISAIAVCVPTLLSVLELIGEMV